MNSEYISSTPQQKRSFLQKGLTWFSHPGFSKYVHNTSWPFFARVVSLVISFIVTTYIARYLGPENYGQLSYAVSFISIFSFIASLGIEQIIYRDLIRHPELQNKYMGSAVVLKVVAGIAATTLAILFSLVTSQIDISFILICILSGTFIFNSLNIITYEFQAKVESKYPSIVSLIIAFVLNALKVLVVVMEQGVIYLAAVLLLESILTSGLLLYYRIKKIGTIRQWTYDSNIARSLIKDAFPLMFSSAFALIYARIDQIFIKHMINTESVGLYDAAVRLTEVWYLIPNVLVGSFFPALVHAKKTSDVEYTKRLGWLGLALLLIAVAIALPTTFIAPWVMNIVFGPAFVAGSLVLQIYIWSNIGTFLGNLSTNYLINENQRFAVFVSSCLGMITNIVLNIVLIPRYGIEGAAVATLISYSLIPASLIFFKEPRQRLKTMLSSVHF